MSQVRGTINRIDVMGWLGGDPELRFTPNGKRHCRISVATKYITGRDSEGRYTYDTEWISVEMWEKLAELCNTYLHKGSRVLVTGGLRTDSWVDKETKQTHYRTFVRADSVLFLDTRTDQPEVTQAVEEAAAQATEDIPF